MLKWRQKQFFQPRFVVKINGPNKCKFSGTEIIYIVNAVYYYFSDQVADSSNLPTTHFPYYSLYVVLKVWTCTFWPRRWALSSETAVEIHEPLRFVKNCAKGIACIISSFLTTWKRDVFISIVWIRTMILAKLKLDFNPSLAYFHAISMTLCCLLRCHTVFCVLILLLTA